MFPLTRGRDVRPVSSRKLCANVTGSPYFVERLTLDRKLDVHTGCVNTVCWNDSGTLLLSGSDDQHLVVSDPFNGKIVTKVRSGHRSNIFCARFLPGTHDREVVSCSGSGEIFYTDLDREDVQEANRFGCHFGTTYKVVVVPNESSTFLSCGDDGTVRFFDLRVKTSCSKMNCEEDVIINLQNSVSSMAVDPVIPYQLAVGSADGVVRIYDRRMLKAREKGGNPKSLICVFQSPMSKTEKRHFRITSLNYRPGAHDVLVNYSSENIYLFNTYDMETTQKYSVEIPKTALNRKSVIVEDSTSAPNDGSTENDEMDDYLGFSPEERRGPSTLYRPIKRLRLRGDWSDTGPNARPENEGQAPTSMIMQRMSDLLTRMLNTHVNEASDDTARSPNQPDVATNQGQASNSIPSSDTSSAMPNVTSLSALRRRGQSEEQQSISSEGLVSAELSPQESSPNVGHCSAEKVRSDYGKPGCVELSCQDKDAPHSSQSGEEVGRSQDSGGRMCPSNDSHKDARIPNVPLEDGGEVVLESRFKTVDESPGSVNDDDDDDSRVVKCDKVDIKYNSHQTSSNNEKVFPSHSLSSATDKACYRQDKCDGEMNSSATDNKRNDHVDVCDIPSTSHSNEFNREPKHCVSLEGKEFSSLSNSSSCQSRYLGQSDLSVSNLQSDTSKPIMLSRSFSEGNCTFAIASRRDDHLSPQTTLDDVSDITSSSVVTKSSTNSLPYSSNQREAWYTGFRGNTDSIDLTRQHMVDHQKLSKVARWGSFDETSLSFKARHSMGVVGPSLSQTDEFEFEDRDSEPDSYRKHGNPNLYESGSVTYSLNSVEEDDDAAGRECDEGQGQKEGYEMESFYWESADAGRKMSPESNRGLVKSEDKDVSHFASFEKSGGQIYPGKGKGIGKSSTKKPQAGEQHDQKKTFNAPYNDGNMKFAVSEKIAAAEKSSVVFDDQATVTARAHPPSSEETATLLSSSSSVDSGIPNHITGVRAEIQDTGSGLADAGPNKSSLSDAGPNKSSLSDAGPNKSSLSDAGPNKTSLSDAGPNKSSRACPCEAVPSTSSGNRTGESSGAAQQSDSHPSRHRRAGYSLPPTGNFQLHSDDENEEDDDDDATTMRKGHQSKSHAARKIQELFRRRRHAKENAHMLNLPQPRVITKFSGHRNCRTMIKESNFYGDKYVMSGSDCGRIFIWERETGRLAMYLEADKHVVNCVQPNPHLPMIASSGIDYDIKLWSPLAEESQFDADVAHMIVQRNELMLVETRDTITVPPALMLRVLASLSHIRAGRTAAAAQSQPENEEEDHPQHPPPPPPPDD